MRFAAPFAIAMLLLVGAVRAQTTAPAADAVSEHPSHHMQEAEEKKWEFSLSAYTYVIPHEADYYVQPTFKADRDWLHFEARYNYENIGATSVWLGANFSFGENLVLDVTPMIGGVFGGPYGVAPGYEFTLSWKRVALYSEAEYVIDTNNSSDSYFYTWSELTYSPLDWLRAGVVIQRTKAYDTEFDIQHGLLVGVTWKQFDVALYTFDLERDPTFVIGVTFSF